MAKKKKSEEASKKPSGLSIDRNGESFTLSWKTHSYEKQELEFSITGLYRNIGTPSRPSYIAYGWAVVDVKKTATSTKVTVPLSHQDSGIFRGSATGLKFRVRGQAKKHKWSGWADKEYKFEGPAKPTVSATLNSEFKTTFTATATNDKTSKKIFRGIEYQYTLSANGAGPVWPSSIQSTSSASVTFPKEEPGWTGNYSYTAWFRARTVGAAGKESAWVQTSHTYAKPARATNVAASAVSKANGGYTVSASWTTQTNAAHPVDSVTAKYMTAVPDSAITASGNWMVTTLTCPIDGNWSEINSLGNKSGARAMAFNIGSNLGRDEALFFRVDTIHDSASSGTTEGYPVLVSNGLGQLEEPSAIVVGDIDMQTKRVIISAKNNSKITASFIAIYFRTGKDTSNNNVIGIIPHDEESVTIQLPDFSAGSKLSFGAKAVVGDYTPIQPKSSGVTKYTVREKMTSGEIKWSEGVPLPPGNVRVDRTPDGSGLQVAWEWTWSEATGAELSWSENIDAWESTDEPSTYVVNNVHASKWIIAGLSASEWHVRIRLFRQVGDDIVYGTYSKIVSTKLSVSPNTPTLTLKPAVITKDGSTTATWAFVSNDGTTQQQAEIIEVVGTNEQGQPIYRDLTPKETTNTSQHLTISAAAHGWLPGEMHSLALRVTSMSGEVSEPSAPQNVSIVNEVTASIESTSLVYSTEDEEYKLTGYPLTVKANGCGVDGTMTYIIERFEDYHVDRPDESEYSGYEGETVLFKVVNGETQQEFTQSDLLGNGDATEARTRPRSYLDDTALYNLYVIAMDSYGQTNESEKIKFRVNWEHQAVMPSADIDIDGDRHVAFITPIRPSEGFEDGDTCDIYRLSADTPELIYEGAEFGTTEEPKKYVDPYPTLGTFGGYRIVYKTYNGDYMIENTESASSQGSSFAWAEYEADDPDHPEYNLDVFAIIIDFNGNQLMLPYDISISNSWSKDFTETKYLGGSVRGDWNPAVSKRSSLTTTIPVQIEPENIELIRRLAVYPGICHVRTPDGSSYSANVDVRDDREERKINMISRVSLDITRVDPEGFDGMTYEAWLKENAEE